MDKRGIIAIGLCILVLVVYQEWISRYYGTAPTPVTTPENKTFQHSGIRSLEFT